VTFRASKIPSVSLSSTAESDGDPTDGGLELASLAASGEDGF